MRARRLWWGQKCASVCGPNTRQQLKARATDPAHWGAYLSSHLLGPQRRRFIAVLAEYTGLEELDRAGWETAAASLGMSEVIVTYAHQASISPGAQLFALASTLFGLGLYTSLGRPKDNAEAWKSSLVS